MAGRPLSITITITILLHPSLSPFPSFFGMRLPLLASLSILLAASLVLAIPTVQLNPDFPDPSIDPFYRVPHNVSHYKNGAVIRSRAVVTNFDVVNVAESYQVLYRSQDTKHRPDATVATIWVPTKKLKKPKLFSYQSYEDSTSFDCSPSWTFVKGSGSANAATASLDTPIYIQWALTQGYHVVASDHEGSQAAFIAGYQEGMASLDGIRATKNHLKLPQDTPVALFGYSGGGHATAWTANLAETYAPEVNIVGAVHGGTPTDTKGIFQFINGGTFSGFAGGGLVGLMNAYPEFDEYIMSIVSDAGKQKIIDYRSDDYCLVDVTSKSVLVNFLDYLQVEDPLNQPIIKKVLARESLLMDVSPVNVSVPKFPRLQYHGLEDEIVPYSDEFKFISQQCAHGANIQFQTLPVAEHITAEILGLVGAIIFVRQIFEGTTPPVACGTGLLDFPTIFSSEAQTLLGKDTVDYLKSLNGTKTAFGSIINFPSILEKIPLL